MRAPNRARQLLAVSAILLSSAAASQAATTAQTGASVFERRQLNPDTTLRSSSLWLSSPGVVRALTPTVAGTYDGSATWSPQGNHIAFQRGTVGTGTHVRYDIFVVDRQGGQARQLTHGLGSYELPVWGPGTRIAFIAKTSANDCLSLIDVDGGRRHDLFCAPSPARLARPQWSKDGHTLFVSGGYYEGQLSPVWHGMAWQVDASTGAATQLIDLVMDEERELTISPDGRRGIFSDIVPNEMIMADFATGATTSVGTGYAPRWSNDGYRVAYTGEVYEFDTELLYYNPLYVMDADGSNVHRVTRARVNNIAYIASDWSDDGTHVLANVRKYDDPALTIPHYALRWIDVADRTLIALPGGYAAPGAWVPQ
jgi:Tol biopolymer transport system component